MNNSNLLFEELIEALEDDYVVLTKEQSIEIIVEQSELFPPLINGRVDWEKVAEKKVFHEGKELTICGKSPSEIEAFLIFDNMKLPGIKTRLSRVLDNLEDVKAVSFDEWIYCREEKTLIELYHGGNTIGQCH